MVDVASDSKTGMPAGTAAQPRLPTIRKPRLLDAAGLKVPLAEHAYAQWRQAYQREEQGR